MVDPSRNSSRGTKRHKSSSASSNDMEQEALFESDLSSLLQFVGGTQGPSRAARIVNNLNSPDPLPALIELNDFLNMSPEDGVFGFPSGLALNALLRLVDGSDHAVLATQCLAAAVDIVEEVAGQLAADRTALKSLIGNFSANFDVSEQVLRVFVRLVSRGHGATLVESEIFSALIPSLVFFDMHTQISVLHAIRDAIQHRSEIPRLFPEIYCIIWEIKKLMTEGAFSPSALAAALEIFTKTDAEILAKAEISDLIEEHISGHEDLVVSLIAKLAKYSPALAKKFRASEKLGIFLVNRELAVALLPEFTVDSVGNFQVSKSTSCRNFVAKLANEFSDPKIFLLHKLLSGAVSAEASALATEIFVGEAIAGVSGRGWMRSDLAISALGILVDLPSNRLVIDGVAAAANAVLGRLGKSRKFSKFSDHAGVRGLCEKIVKACEGLECELATGKNSDLPKFTPHQILISDDFVEACLDEEFSEKFAIDPECISMVRRCVARAQHAVVESVSVVPKISGIPEILRVRLIVGNSAEAMVVGVDPRLSAGALAEEISDRLDRKICFRAGELVPADMPLIDALMRRTKNRKFETFPDLLVLDDAKAANSLCPEIPANFWQTLHTLNVEDEVPDEELSDQDISDSLANIACLWKNLVRAGERAGTALPPLVVPELSKKIGDSFLTPQVTFLMSEIPFAFELSDRRRVLLGPSEPARRQRLTISRSRLIEETLKALGSLRADATLEIAFRGEAGSGSGPANEYFALVSEEFRKIPGFFRNPDLPLFPGLEVSGNFLEIWKLLGWLCGRALADGRVTELDIDPLFWASMREEFPFSFRQALARLDSEYARSLEALVSMEAGQLAELEISCRQVPGADNVKVTKLGNSKFVTRKNVERFVDRVAEISVFEGVTAQREAFVSGISEVVDLERLLGLFSDSEISGLLFNGGRSLAWSRKSLETELLVTNGYAKDSRVVDDLFEVLCEMEIFERSEFIRFVTGARSLPASGLVGLKPQLTVVKAIVSGNPDDFLPSVMTCAHFLKLPDYSSKLILKQQLTKAITDGQNAFHLS